MVRVLIVDDGALKLSRLFAMLDGCGIPRRDVQVAQCAQEARQKLKAELYDVVLLDILLPLRHGDVPAEQHSLELLMDMVERATFKRPKQVIGLTAYQEAAERAAPAFADMLWTVIVVSESDDEWLRKLENCFDYLINANSQLPAPSYDVDICIVSALADPEHRAILAIPWQWKAERPIDDATFVSEGKFRSGDQEFRAVAAAAPRMGSVASAVLACKLIQAFRPRFLVMSGICAGYKSECVIGDVILADASWDYQSGKHWLKQGEKQFSIAPHHITVPEFIRARAEQLRRDEAVWNAIRTGFSDPPREVPKLLIGPLASGSAVRADEEDVGNIKEHQHRKLAGIDMEVYGVYAAALSAGEPKPTAIAFKAVQDYADDAKGDAFRKYAAHVSAKTLQVFFERFLHEINTLAGR